MTFGTLKNNPKETPEGSLSSIPAEELLRRGLDELWRGATMWGPGDTGNATLMVASLAICEALKAGSEHDK